MTRWVSAGLLMLVAACGGMIAPTSEVGPGGGPAGDDETRGSVGANCSSESLGATRACVPGIGRAKSAIQVEIDRPDGCVPCGGQIQPCTVAVRGSAITLSAQVQVCAPQDQSCATICEVQKTTCQLPPLDPGTYTVALADGVVGSSFIPRQLVIQPTGEVACSLAAPPTITVAAYATACTTDADCTSITTGDPCAECTCPNAAISTKSQARYEGDWRSAISQCSSVDSQLGCGCPQVTAVCNAGHLCDIGP